MSKSGYNIRNHHFKRVFKKRLKCKRWFYMFRDLNGDIIQNPTWMDLIGDKSYMFLKYTSSTEYDSRYKVKYSPNNTNRKYRDLKKGNSSTSLREKDKVLVRKIIKSELNEFYTKN